MTDLAVKYRPKTFADVIGQDAVVGSLQKLLERGTFSAILLSGPSGCGKTTLARIVAHELGAERHNILEIDAATYTGIDSMREVTGSLVYQGLGKSNQRFVIIDEAHALSKASFQSLLKSLEEPPAHVRWALCTTEPTRIPQNIKTRCVSYSLKAVDRDTLFHLLDRVRRAEKFDCPDDVLSIAVKMAGGSPRQALINLSAVSGCDDRREARQILDSPLTATEPGVALCQALLTRASWEVIMGLLADLKDENPESIRLMIVNYMQKVAMGVKTEKAAGRALTILDAFCGQPYTTSEKLGPLIVAIGHALYD